MSPESERLKVARATGSLTNVIGALREQARTELADAGTPVREQLGVEDAAIRVASGLTGKNDVERRAALREVRPGTTVSAQGVVAKTRPTYAQQLAKALAWAKTLTESQRNAYITGEKFEALPDHTQGLVADAFGTVDDEELVLEDTVGEPFDPATYNFDAELVDPDQLADEDDDEIDESCVDPVDAAYLNGETNYYTGEENQ
jgi:hypothetical protein